MSQNFLLAFLQVICFQAATKKEIINVLVKAFTAGVNVYDIFQAGGKDTSSNKRKTWKGIMIKDVLKRRREWGTYLATARRHRRRLKMQKRDE